jgi:2-iminobutanoate/2-iminopropanoate deaminase
MKEAVRTDSASKGVGPYSQAVKANGFIFISGQLALDPLTHNIVEGGFDVQVEQAIKNTTAILVAADSDWGKVVKVTVFLKDLNNFSRMNEIYVRVLQGVPPARTAVEVARLPRDAMIEIDIIALA